MRIEPVDLMNIEQHQAPADSQTNADNCTDRRRVVCLTCKAPVNQAVCLSVYVPFTSAQFSYC